jgi:hypothetical protein
VHQGQPDRAVVALQGGAALQFAQHRFRVGIAAQLHHHAHAFAVALVADVGEDDSALAMCPASMPVPAVLFHYEAFQPLWQQAGLIQAGPRLRNGLGSVRVHELGIQALQAALTSAGLPARGVLLHYTDPFLLRAQPLRGQRHWCGPRLLVCGDLHHGERPLDALAAYLEAEPHDAVLLSFNPALLPAVRQRLQVPVRALPPSFFRYPAAVRVDQPRLELLHVGSLGPHHPSRRELVLALQARGRLPFRHATTSSPEEAAALYAKYALILNVPLNHDLNHRFFEVMAAGALRWCSAIPAWWANTGPWRSGRMCSGRPPLRSWRLWGCGYLQSPSGCGGFRSHHRLIGS